MVLTGQIGRSDRVGMSATTSATMWSGSRQGLEENFSKVMSDSERLRDVR